MEHRYRQKKVNRIRYLAKEMGSSPITDDLVRSLDDLRVLGEIASRVLQFYLLLVGSTYY
jgi:hypothetical protein